MHFLFKILLVYLVYINSFGADLTLQVKKPNHSLLAREGGDLIEYHPNSKLHWGFKLSGSSFYIEYGQKINNSSFKEDRDSTADYKDYKIGLNFSNIFFEVFYKEYKGFLSNEQDDSTGCDLCSVRSRLTSREFNISHLFAFNGNFSMKALMSSGIGEFSSSSGVVIGYYLNRLKVSDPDGLAQNDKVTSSPDFARYNAVEMKQGGLSLGYGQIKKFNSLFYAAWYGAIGGGYQEYEVFESDTSSDGTGLGGMWSLRLNLGTHGNNAVIGLKGLLHSNLYDLGSDLNFASVNYAVYLYTVFRI